MKNYISITNGGNLNFSQEARRLIDIKTPTKTSKTYIGISFKKEGGSVLVSLKVGPVKKSGWRTLQLVGVPIGAQLKKDTGYFCHQARGKYGYDFNHETGVAKFSFKPTEDAINEAPECPLEKRAKGFLRPCAICCGPTKASYNGLSFSWVCLPCRETIQTSPMCHFCGGGTNVLDWRTDQWWVHCIHCNARGPSQPDHHSAIGVYVHGVDRGRKPGELEEARQLVEKAGGVV